MIKHAWFNWRQQVYKSKNYTKRFIMGIEQVIDKAHTTLYIMVLKVSKRKNSMHFKSGPWGPFDSITMPNPSIPAALVQIRTYLLGVKSWSAADFSIGRGRSCLLGQWIRAELMTSGHVISADTIGRDFLEPEKTRAFSVDWDSRRSRDLTSWIPS